MVVDIFRFLLFEYGSIIRKFPITRFHYGKAGVLFFIFFLRAL